MFTWNGYSNTSGVIGLSLAKIVHSEGLTYNLWFKYLFKFAKKVDMLWLSEGLDNI